MASSAELAPAKSHRPEPQRRSFSAFDYEIESERIRWFHRRLLLFCAIKLALETLRLLASIASTIPPIAPFVSVDPVPRWGSFLALQPLICLAYLGAVLYLLRVRPLPPLQRLLRLAVCVAGLLPALTILLGRIEFSPAHAQAAAATAARASSAAPGAAWTLTAPAGPFFHFGFACLLIPWTVREALATAAVLLATYAAIMTADLHLTAPIPTMPAALKTARVSFVAAALALLPGLVVCWWRFSRFPRRYRMLFDIADYRKLQQELALARKLHESTLPPHDLHTAGPIRLAYVYEPMREIGGDILYVHPPRDGQAQRVSVVLIDVSGHGIGAALMANRVMGEVQRLFAESPDPPPHRILSALNRYACLTLARDAVFATAVCLRIDAQASLIECANGGHPAPFLIRADGSHTALESDAFLLGVQEDGDDYCPESQTLPFGPGDVLLAYTDGATEARNPAGQMITIAGLRDLVTQLNGTSPADWPDDLIDRIIAYRHAPPEDDTLLAAIYRPPTT